MSITAASNTFFKPMDLPTDLSLPLFVYGAMKPGLPAHRLIQGYISDKPKKDNLKGILYSRGGLPLLKADENQESIVEGYLIKWLPRREQEAYEAVCSFESSGQYDWEVVSFGRKIKANVLVIRDPLEGNPFPLEETEWTLSHDPAFGHALDAVKEMIREITLMTEYNGPITEATRMAIMRDLGQCTGSDGDYKYWPRFYKCHMAYLLLWSILERLSAFSFGFSVDPLLSVTNLHKEPKFADVVAEVVKREDKIADSWNPSKSYYLTPSNPHQCILYYYQIHKNISHRGDGLSREYLRIFNSLLELYTIISRYLEVIAEGEREHSQARILP